ncbi:hypothetical protein Tco_1474461 [Tanacetum coccineum]
MTSCGKKKSSHLLIPSVREIFGMPIHDALLTDVIKGAPYYNGYLEHVAEYQRYLDEEHNKAEEEEVVTESPNASKATKPKAAKQTKPSVPKAAKVTQPADDKTPKPTSSQPPKPTPAPTEPSRKDQDRKRKLVKETSDTPSPAKRSKRHTPMPIEPSGHAESPSLDAELAQTDSEMESDEEVPPVNPEKDASYRELIEINTRDQDEGQAGPNPGKQEEGQVGSNPGDLAESQPQPSHVVHAGPNLEHMDLEATDTLTQQNPKQIDEEFTTTAYPNVQENLKLPTEDQVILEDPASSIGTLSSIQNLNKDLSFTNQFFVEKPQEEEPEKTNTESEVQSMVMVPIH